MAQASKTTSQANVIHELQHAAQQYRLITSNEEIIQRTGAQIVIACQLHINAAAWQQNFAIAVEEVRQWCKDHPNKIALVLVDLRSDKTVFYVIPRSDEFDFELAQQQTDLNISLNTRGAIGYVETRQIPPWEIARFVGENAYRVWPNDIDQE